MCRLLDCHFSSVSDLDRFRITFLIITKLILTFWFRSRLPVLAGRDRDESVGRELVVRVGRSSHTIPEFRFGRGQVVFDDLDGHRVPAIGISTVIIIVSGCIVRVVGARHDDFVTWELVYTGDTGGTRFQRLRLVSRRLNGGKRSD